MRLLLADDAIEAFYLGRPDLAAAWEGEIAIRRGQVEKARPKLSQAIASDSEGITGLWATGLLSALNGDHGRWIEAARKWGNANLVLTTKGGTSSPGYIA